MPKGGEHMHLQANTPFTPSRFWKHLRLLSPRHWAEWAGDGRMLVALRVPVSWHSGEHGRTVHPGAPLLAGGRGYHA